MSWSNKLKTLVLIFQFCLPLFAVTLKVPVAPGLEKYQDILTAPGALVLALGSQDIKLSQSGDFNVQGWDKVELIRKYKMPFERARFERISHKGTSYDYRASIDWNFGIATREIQLDLALNTASWQKGFIEVTIDSKILSSVSGVFMKYIRERVDSLAAMPLQTRLLKGLKEFDQKSEAQRFSQLSFMPALMMKAYQNKSQVVGLHTMPHPGDAEPVSNQTLVISTVLFWLFMLPLYLILGNVFRRFVFPRKKLPVNLPPMSYE